MGFRQNVAVLYSASSCRAHREEARRQGALYRFRGARGTVQWVQEEHAYLAVNGLLSLLRRLAIHCDVIQEDEASPEVCRAYDLIFVPNAGQLAPRCVASLGEVSRARTKLVVSGATNLPDALLCIRSKTPHIPHGFIGLRGLPLPHPQPCLVAPPGYPVFRTIPAPGARGLGTLEELPGPDGGEARELEAPGIIVSDRTLFLPFPLFEFVGGLLQGHLDIEGARGHLGDAANFHLDRLAWLLKELVPRTVWQGFGQVRLRPWGAHDHVLILRHDTDSSQDLTYLEFERAQRVPATYAILLDDHAEFWLRETVGDPLIERAAHFPSNQMFRCLGLFPSRTIRPSKRAITGRGLARRVLRAARRFEAPCATAHRHAGFFYYPETVEAMDRLYEGLPELLGLGTMFRFTCFRYSASRGADRAVVPIRHPDVGVSLWIPFRLQVSTLEAHRTLRGWDSSALIEPDPAMMDLVFANAARLPHGVYTLVFHPAHARGTAFQAGGNFAWFLYAFERAVRGSWWIASAATVYRKLDEWQQLRVRSDGERIQMHNAGPRPAEGLVLEVQGSPCPVGTVGPGAIQVMEGASIRAR